MNIRFVLLVACLVVGCQSNTSSMPGAIQTATQLPTNEAIPNGPCVATALIPLYSYPGTTWTQVRKAHTWNPALSIVAIINPASGPGPSPDPNYVSGIAALQRAGVTVLGYDHTSYGARPLADVENDALLYHQWYRVDGVFFDEMANTAGHEQYYSSASTYAKSLSMRLTIGNTGTDTVPSYVGTVDSMVIYESRGYPPLSRFGGWHTSYPKATWGSISYATPALNAGKVCGIARVAGYIYVTNDTLPNPYDTLPRYFETYINVL
jgi:spherulation-specific family 4 protein